MSRNSRPWSRPIDQMGAWLDSEGFYRKHTARDGTCLFRAVAEQLFFTQVYHSDVRRATVDYILRNPRRFQPMVDEPIDEYAERMRSQKEYGGKVEIEALSVMYKCDFLIYREMGQPAEEFTKNGFEPKIVLCNTLDRHYDSVFTKDYIDKAAFVQSIVYEMLYDKVFELKEVEYAVNKMLHDKTYKHQREHQPFIDCFSIRYEMRDNYTNAKDLLDFGITPFPYKVAKSLDLEIYRNVEYDTWNDYRKGLRYGFCTWNCRELEVGVKCSIKIDENTTHVGHIQHMSPNKGPVTVYIEKIGEMMTVPYQSLELIPQPPLILPPVRPSSALNMKYANLLSSMSFRRGVTPLEFAPRIKRPTKLNLQTKAKKDGVCSKNKMEKQQETGRESQHLQEANSFSRQDFDDSGLADESIKPNGYERRTDISVNDTALSEENEGSAQQIYSPMEGTRNHVYVLNPQPVATNGATAVQEHRPALFPLPPPIPIQVNLMTQKSVNLDGSDLPHSDLSTLRFCYNLGVDCLRMNYVAWNVRPNSPLLVNSSATLLTQTAHSSYMAIDGQYIANDAIAIAADGTGADDVVHSSRNMLADSAHHPVFDNSNCKKCVVAGSNDGLVQHPEISSTTPSSPTNPLSPVAFYYQTDFEQPVGAPIMEYVYEIGSPAPVYPYPVHYVSQDGILYHPVMQGPAMIPQPQHPSI